ncbi:MAG: hypothetical protein K1Y01_00565 [Vicinamibacteria bacterium]|nr:hypothetical protein [Vicinamibacteria bacterium]
MTIRQNLDSKKDVAKPGFFEIKAPKGERAIYGIGLGVSFDLGTNCEGGEDNSFTTISPAFEVLLNTSVKEETRSYKAGFEFESILGHAAVAKARESRTTAGSLVLLGRANFKEDRVKNTKSLQLAAYLTHFSIGKGLKGRPNYELGTDGFRWLYSPQIGFEVDHVYAAEKPGDEGEVIRAVAQIDLWMYPAAAKLEQRLVINGTYAFRQDVEDSTAATDDSHSTFTGGITYSFIKTDNREAGIGVTHIRGEDPSKSFARQNLWQIGLKIQFK